MIFFRLILLTIIVYAIFKWLWKDDKPKQKRPPTHQGEQVVEEMRRDPVCGTYVPASLAVTATHVVLELEFFAVQLPVQVGTSTNEKFTVGQVRYLVNSHGPNSLLVEFLDFFFIRHFSSSRMICHHSDSARRLRPATPTKQKGQHKPCDKSADVRHISHAARVRCVGNGTDAAKKLQNDPEPNDYQRGHLHHLLALQYSDLSLGEQQNVSAEHTRNRPRCSQIRHV